MAPSAGLMGLSLPSSDTLSLSLPSSPAFQHTLPDSSGYWQHSRPQGTRLILGWKMHQNCRENLPNPRLLSLKPHRCPTSASRVHTFFSYWQFLEFLSKYFVAGISLATENCVKGLPSGPGAKIPHSQSRGLVWPLVRELDPPCCNTKRSHAAAMIWHSQVKNKDWK